MRIRFSRHSAVLAICAVGLASCARSALVVKEGQTSPDPEAGSLGDIPTARDPDVGQDFVKHSIRRPLGYVFIPPKAFRDWFGSKVEAYNPTADDDVADSNWFTHRNGRKRMTPEEVARGPIDGMEPDTSGAWTVIAAKVGGITPGFRIRDAAGVEYLIKFDPPENPELMTAAEAITQRLFHAAGYNTPATYVTVFDPAKVRAAESLMFEDEFGRERPATNADVQELLRSMPQRPDGRIRAVASQLLQGRLGPFSYEGRRKDDPADIIPHQHRRDLRGLYVMAAWLNHLDTKQQNSLDVLVEENDRRFVKHYLIDFGSSLGSSSIYPNAPRDGVEYDVDLGDIGSRLITAGIYTSSWERYDHDGPEYPSIGFYSPDLFRPGSWKPNYPNPAFKNRTVRDGYWGAKLVASFDEEQIRAAVATGELSNPKAEEVLVRGIVARRDLTVRYWFLRVTPLEELAVTGTWEGPDPAVLAFRDLAVAEGIVPAAGRRYEMRFDFPAAGLRMKEVRAPRLSGNGEGELVLPMPTDAHGNRIVGPEFWESLRSRPLKKRLAKLELRAIAGPGQPRPRSVRVYLLPDRERGYRVVGRAY